MRILITNDDGIRAPILPHLARKIAQQASVTVVAPKHEQSGQSQAIDFRRKIEITPFELAEGIEAWAMDSTPADCVRFAVLGLGRQYDCVISGINCGYNLGDDIAYSGTVGAILEGARLGMPGVALSTSPDALFEALASLDAVFGFVREKELFRYSSLYNINIPKDRQGFSITGQGGMFFTDAFVKGEDGLYAQIGEPISDPPTDKHVDIDAVRLGLVSITPLVASHTNFAALERLKRL